MAEENGRQDARRFDPFRSRKARDLRNQLSESLMEALAAGHLEPAEKAAAAWLVPGVEPVLRRYAADRLDRYRRAFDDIEALGAEGDFERTLTLWNHGLYFEAHESLEPGWRASKGRRRDALKGVIQAAAAQAHLELGHDQAARKLASKAAALLHENGRALPRTINLDDLLAHLEDPATQPPELHASKPAP